MAAPHMDLDSAFSSDAAGIPSQQRRNGGGSQQAAHATADQVRQGPAPDLALGHRPAAGALRLPSHR